MTDPSPSQMYYGVHIGWKNYLNKVELGLANGATQRILLCVDRAAGGLEPSECCLSAGILAETLAAAPEFRASD